MKNVENRKWVASGNVKSLDRPMREAKRKHSPPRVLTKAQVVGAITTIGKAFSNQAHTPSRSPNNDIRPYVITGLEVSSPSKLKTSSSSSKGKRVAERIRVSKEGLSITSQMLRSRALEGFWILPRPCKQTTRDEKPIKGGNR